MRLITLFLLLTILFPLSSFAPKEKKPDCILFMLHHSARKIEAMKKRKMNKEALILEAEDKDLNDAIMLDFSKNFKFCPVYFFYSEDFDQVKAKNWDLVTFISSTEMDKTSISSKIINAKTYFIGEVNYPPIAQYKILNGKETKPESAADAGYANTNDPYGITLYYDNFVLLQSKLVYTNSDIRKVSRKPKKIKFFGAEKLSTKLNKYFSTSK